MQPCLPLSTQHLPTHPHKPTRGHDSDKQRAVQPVTHSYSHKRTPLPLSGRTCASPLFASPPTPCLCAHTACLAHTENHISFSLTNKIFYNLRQNIVFNVFSSNEFDSKFDDLTLFPVLCLFDVVPSLSGRHSLICLLRSGHPHTADATHIRDHARSRGYASGNQMYCSKCHNARTVVHWPTL